MSTTSRTTSSPRSPSRRSKTTALREAIAQVVAQRAMASRPLPKHTVELRNPALSRIEWPGVIVSVEEDACQPGKTHIVVDDWAKDKPHGGAAEWCIETEALDLDELRARQIEGGRTLDDYTSKIPKFRIKDIRWAM